MPNGISILTNRSPDLNSSTLRHICGAPNHFRCWKREVYFKIGGHNPRLRIADDYELVLKTFLETKFIHITAPCYLQRFDGKNSQYAGTNIRDIQRRVRWASNFYNERIHNRVIELGFDEKVYEKNNAYKTMSAYCAKKDLMYLNYIYTPEWQTYPIFQTAKENIEYVEKQNNKENEKKDA